MKKTLIFTVLFFLVLSADCQTFDLTKPQPVYSEKVGYGYDVLPAPAKKNLKPFFFSVKVPDGNYKVTVTLGSRYKAAQTVVRAESRRLFLENTPTAKGKYKTFTFVVSKRSPYISDSEQVRLNQREHGSLDWDEKLTLEFNGPAPAVKAITVVPDTTAVTVFLCGNSTVVDQAKEPWASWGQMVPRWFDDRIAISNHAESGLTATSFIHQNRLDKVLSMLRKGDWVFCEFGHNDQKEHGPGAGAWYNFSYALKIFIDKVRQAGGHIVFVTPTQRRFWDDAHTHILETHGDYPQAMRTVAKREKVPVIELHDMTRTFFETLGFDDSRKALVQYPANTFPGQTKALEDNTHFNPYGAYEVAKMVVMGMKVNHLNLVEDLRSDWKDYDSAHPDNWKTYRWYPSPMVDFVKPAGN
jgi:lysophospholipase L1-like esterase